MIKFDDELFNLLEKKTNERWKRFEKFYVNDSKPFINKIIRDYRKTGKFPIHVLKTIKNIDKKIFNGGVCILRGGLPYSILFEAYGWNIHYIICGRINEKNSLNMNDLRLNKTVDSNLKNVQGKKVLLIENNSFNGNTCRKTAMELIKSFKIQKPDLFLDYFIKSPHLMKEYGKKAFLESNNEKRKTFGKIYEAKSTKVQEKYRIKLIKEFIEKLKGLK